MGLLFEKLGHNVKSILFSISARKLALFLDAHRKISSLARKSGIFMAATGTNRAKLPMSAIFILTENFFMDNHSDLEYLQSRAGKQAVVDTHVEGIVEWLESN